MCDFAPLADNVNTSYLAVGNLWMCNGMIYLIFAKTKVLPPKVHESMTYCMCAVKNICTLLVKKPSEH